MSNEFTELKIICKTFPDVEGQWTKAEAEADMIELTGRKPTSPTLWMEYVLEHSLEDFSEFTSELEKIILNPLITRIQFRLGNDEVAVIKTRAR